MQPGLYQHYKGNFYQVLGLGLHEETHEELVIYRALYGDYTLWVRPRDVFTQTVIHNNSEIPRFKFIKAL